MLKPLATTTVVFMEVSLSFLQKLGWGERLSPYLVIWWQCARCMCRGKYVAGASILNETLVAMFLLVVLNVFPFSLRYIIPLSNLVFLFSFTNMMVENAMTVTGITMKKLRDDIKLQTNLTALALGATSHRATLEQVRINRSLPFRRWRTMLKQEGLISLRGNDMFNNGRSVSIGGNSTINHSNEHVCLCINY
ncbi:hypothetical protein K2173_014489 [Erythroxylum novogranatense]|uniref:Uncharacterized protein n=1 Tax=Erythroxylum novogranatense TaxID=1862640 RepID=A0AAV8S4J2_9ROSI|nr:hypothetical protein K2173_014489 [Erythroxylum novogranatense]